MRTIPRSLALMVVVLAVGLGGCGGDDEPEPAGATETTQPQPPPAAETTTATETETEADDGGGAETGSMLELGETARVKREPLSAPSGGNQFYMLDVTVLEIEKGSIDQFENFDLDPDQKQSTPYYVRARLANPEGKVPADDDPALGLDGVDDRGQEQGRLIIIGDYERCDYAEVPKPFRAGQSYETCLIFLMPGGGSIEEVRWTGAAEYITEEPITWR